LKDSLRTYVTLLYKYHAVEDRADPKEKDAFMFFLGGTVSETPRFNETVFTEVS
jgi:hypothetical protein